MRRSEAEEDKVALFYTWNTFQKREKSLCTDGTERRRRTQAGVRERERERERVGVSVKTSTDDSVLSASDTQAKKAPIVFIMMKKNLG